MTEDERVMAIQVMADAMENGAHYYGPNSHQISGNKHILAERALDALLTKVTVITLPGVRSDE